MNSFSMVSVIIEHNVHSQMQCVCNLYIIFSSKSATLIIAGSPYNQGCPALDVIGGLSLARAEAACPTAPMSHLHQQKELTGSSCHVQGHAPCYVCHCVADSVTLLLHAHTCSNPAIATLLLRTFKEIASTEGSKSMDKKKSLIGKLIVGSRQNETGYIMRALQGKLRIGLAEQTVLVALAHAVLLHRQGDRDKDGKLAGQLEEASQAVKYVYSQCPSYDQLVPALLNYPVSVSLPASLSSPHHGFATAHTCCCDVCIAFVPPALLPVHTEKICDWNPLCMILLCL